MARRHLYPRLDHLTRSATYPDGPILAASFLQSGLGIGEAARMEVLALRAAGMPPQLKDVSPIHGIRDLESDAFADTPDPSPHGLLLLHLNAPETALALRFLGEELTRNRPIVGVWAWELPRPDPDWLLACRYLDEVWVPSRYVGETFAGRCPIPVRVVPHPVPRPAPAGLGRARFGLPDRTCLFLCMGDARSDLERKNILGTVQAFREAFGESPQAHLVLKVHHLDAAPAAQRVRAAIASAPNVSLFADLLPREHMADFLDCADVLVSLHRAEGFGLPLAEAMLLGKPVIATAYSGNLEFMTPDCAALVGYQLVPVRADAAFYRSLGSEVRWAEPDLREAAAWMRRLAGSESLRQELGSKGREHASRAASPDLFVAAVRQARARFARP